MGCKVRCIVYFLQKASQQRSVDKKAKFLFKTEKRNAKQAVVSSHPFTINMDCVIVMWWNEGRKLDTLCCD